jgi:hypothetical protein
MSRDHFILEWLSDLIAKCPPRGARVWIQINWRERHPAGLVGTPLDALARIQPGACLDESGFLNVFDSNRDLICAAAARVYVRGSKDSYDLVAVNF